MCILIFAAATRFVCLFPGEPLRGIHCPARGFLVHCKTGKRFTPILRHIPSRHWVPTVRNKTSGHGQGPTPTNVPEHMTRYVLHLTATTIVFLIESHKALP